MNGLVDEGEIGTTYSNVDRSKLTPGALIIFGPTENYHAHIAVYSGTYNGVNFITLINNRNFESYVRVIKVDTKTDKTIPYAAAFKIFNSDGKLVTMSLSDTYYN